MAINVHSYTRHVGGNLVTVRGYAADRKALYAHAPAPVHKEMVARGYPTMEAPVGTFVQGSVHRGIGGLTAQSYGPGSPNRDMTNYRWRTHTFPIRNAYKIPKTDSGNPNSYTGDN